MQQVHDQQFKNNNLDQCFKEDFDTKLHDLLNFLLLFEFLYKARNFLNDKLTQVKLYCALIAYNFYGNFLNFWKCKSMIYTEIFLKTMLIRIPSLKNDSCIFLSALEILHFDVSSGDDGAITSIKFICYLSPLLYRRD